MKQYDLEEEIRNCPEIIAKIRAENKSYAQNLYAAWCNMQWCKRDPNNVWPILNEEYWSASWRRAGGIIAHLRNKGEDYMDYYCSGMGGVAALPEEIGHEDELEAKMAEKKYVPEGVVTEEIEEDLNKLGWFPVPYDDDYI